jgi:hypothetical protein
MPLVRRFCFSLCLLCFAGLAGAQPLASVYDLSMQVGGMNLLRPNGVYVDPRSQELYIADSGNSRIVIFDQSGHFNFAFADRRHLSAPVQIAVDSLGQIYVLSESRNEGLSVFDYDGTYLRNLALTDNSGQPLSIESFLLDDQDRVIVASCFPPRISVFAADGKPLFGFPLQDDSGDSSITKQALLGHMACFDNMLVIPMPMIAQIACYSLDGTFIRNVGMAGGAPGTLSFPVAAVSDGQGGMMVLDKMRHTVLQYRGDGEFVREFGGLGVSPGWLYMPQAMAVNKDGVFFIAQNFMNRVQAVKAPELASSASGLSVAPQKKSAATSADSN